MSLIALVIVLAIVGVLLYFVNTIQQIDPTVKKIINIVVVIAIILFLLKVFGVWGEISTIKI